MIVLEQVLLMLMVLMMLLLPPTKRSQLPRHPLPLWHRLSGAALDWARLWQLQPMPTKSDLHNAPLVAEEVEAHSKKVRGG